MRGEQRMDDIRLKTAPGSPPLARGTGARADLIPQGIRITPACAGNSKVMAKTTIKT